MFNFFSKKSAVRVRIAPSPTGFLHIGTARTALFNWLFVRQHNGTFVLRIEDTDIERSEKRFETDIIDGLRWLGLTWDEGPYRQSDRIATYTRHLEKLLEKGDAYYCACTKEALEEERLAMSRAGQILRYSGKCRNQQITAAQGQVIRFKVAPEKITFTDMIRGELSFDMGLVGDIAIAKNLQTPLYNFAVVVDDAEMKISHVIRGEDHIANTPKQIALQRALGLALPQYAHLPLILDPDRSKMSKRFSAVSIEEYRKQGYVSEALFNFIALLGWHPKDEQEIFTREELVKVFELERVQKAGAIFDVGKLNWLNGQYIKKSSVATLKKLLTEVFGNEVATWPYGDRLIEASRDRMERLVDFKIINDFFFALPAYEAQLLVWKDTPKGKILSNLQSSYQCLKTLSDFTQLSVESTLLALTQTEGKGPILWPLRMALSGKDKSPSPFEIMAVLGKEETLRRIEIAIQKLEKE